MCSLGQSEVLEWLIMKREHGDKSYFTAKQVHDGMIRDGLLSKNSPCLNNGAIYDKLTKLWFFDVIEGKSTGTIMRPRVVYRAKVKKVLKT